MVGPVRSLYAEIYPLRELKKGFPEDADANGGGEGEWSSLGEEEQGTLYRQTQRLCTAPAARGKAVSTRTRASEWCRNASGKEEQRSGTAEGILFASVWACGINKHLVSRVLYWFSLYLLNYLTFLLFLFFL